MCVNRIHVSSGVAWNNIVSNGDHIFDTTGIVRHHIIPQRVIKDWMNNLDAVQKRDLVQMMKDDYFENQQHYDVSEQFIQNVVQDAYKENSEEILLWNEEKFSYMFYSYFLYHPGFVFLPPNNKKKRVGDPMNEFEENFECSFSEIGIRNYEDYKKIYEEMVKIYSC